MENIDFQKKNTQETQKTLEKRHTDWLIEARIGIESVALGAAIIGASSFVLESMGVHTSTGALTTVAVSAIWGYSDSRRKSLYKKHDDK